MVAAKDNVKILTSCPSCLQGLSPLRQRPGQRPAGSRLHRGRDGQQDPGRGLDARVRGGRQPRRHRAGAGMTAVRVAGCPLCEGARRPRGVRGAGVSRHPRGRGGLSRLLPRRLERPCGRVVRSGAGRRARCAWRRWWSWSRCLREALAPAKINLAALGNMVPHLHWHVIARFDWDSRFPALGVGRQRSVSATRKREAAIEVSIAGAGAENGPAPGDKEFLMAGLQDGRTDAPVDHRAQRSRACWRWAFPTAPASAFPSS